MNRHTGERRGVPVAAVHTNVDALDLSQRISLRGRRSAAGGSQFWGLSVYAELRPTPLQAFVHLVTPGMRLMPRDVLTGGMTPEAAEAAGVVDGLRSVELAAAAACRYAGMPVGEFGGGALVLRAVGDLLEGDVITAVDGTPTYTVPDLVFRLASVKETCSLSVARHNEELLTLQLNRGEEGLWGLRVVTYRPRTELPVDLSAEIEPDWVGPSLGLMLGLSFLDALVGFAGGLSVAGTGILKSDGSLEAVGGVEYKARAARNLSIPVLLMPTSQSLDDQAAVKSIYNGSLFFVNTLSEAVETLEGLATS